MNDKRRRILLVEDDAAVAAALSKFLTRRGYEVTQVSEAEDALTRCRAETFDLVVSDVHLPGASGLDLARELHRIAPLQPVVLVTGDRDEDIARLALEVGATAYLQKPFDVAELEAAVRQALAGRQVTDSALDLLKAEFGGAADEGLLGHVSSAVLHLAEQRSGSGPGHGYRVARVANALLIAAGSISEENDDVELAARVHELGALVGSTGAVADLHARTLYVLHELGVAPAILDLVDGLYRPGRYRKFSEQTNFVTTATAALAAADLLDHAFIEQRASNAAPSDAERAALARLHERGLDDLAPITAFVPHAMETMTRLWRAET
ncbi:MAG: response regulator [Gemmatimonadota bacterium]